MKKPEYEWWVQHAHTDSAFLFLMEEPDLFAQQVLSRLDKVGRGSESEQSKQEVVNQAMWRAIHEQDRFGAMTSILEDIQAPSRSMRPVVPGSLHLDRAGTLFDSSGMFLGLGVSAFWLPWAFEHNRDQFTRFCEWAHTSFTYVRWFGCHDWDGGTPAPQRYPGGYHAYFSLMEEVIKELARHNLRSFITLYTRRSMFERSDDAISASYQWGHLVNRHLDKVVGVEIVNESSHPDNGWNTGAVRQLSHTFMDVCPHVGISAVSAPVAQNWEETEYQLRDLYTGSKANAVTVHFSRKRTSESPWRWVRQPWHLRSRFKTDDELGRGSNEFFTVDNEPQRWDKSVGGRDVSVALAAPLVSWLCGSTLTCHHDSYGVHADRGEYCQDASSNLVKDALAELVPHIPPDLPSWTPTRVGLEGVWFPHPELLSQHWTFEDDQSNGVSRSYAAFKGNKWVMVLTGVRGHVQLKDHGYPNVKVIPLTAPGLARGIKSFNDLSDHSEVAEGGWVELTDEVEAYYLTGER